MMLLWLLACPKPHESAEPTPEPTLDTGDGTLSDPLSMPIKPLFEASAFASAEDCKSCHPTHYEQWKSSNHAYAIQDPLFQKLVMARQTTYEGAQDRFCNQCHSAIGVRSGEISPGFSYESLPSIVQEGITCESCHKVTGLARDYNSGHILDPSAPIQGPIADPIANNYHASVENPLHTQAEFCGACHDVIEASGVDLERPYREWLQSPAKSQGTTCQTCHMTTTTGPAATGGPNRTLHDHRFIGVDIPPGSTEHAAGVAQLLTNIAEVTLNAPPSIPAGQEATLLISVKNLIPGHNLPTGSTFIRELWLEVTAHDASGNLLYQSGQQDENQDLCGHWSVLDPYGDPDLITFHSGLIDANGQPTLFPWEASEHWSNTIPPLYTRTVSYFIPLDQPGPITLNVALKFRPLSPHLLDLVGITEEVPVYELAAAQGEILVQ